MTTENIDFPTKLEGDQSRDRSGSWAIRVEDVYTAMNPKYAGGTNGLHIQIVNEKSGNPRVVFYPEPSGEGKNRRVPQRTRKLLEQLERLGLSPDKIGGWGGLRGYRLAWVKEKNSFEDKVRGKVEYECEFPIKILETPSGEVPISADDSAEEAQPTSLFDMLKNSALGKTKTEFKYAVATNSDLSAEFGSKFTDNVFIDSMIDDGILALVNGQLQKGENF